MSFGGRVDSGRVSSLRRNLSLSIIVPTYKECGNLKALADRTFAAFGAEPQEERPSFVEMIIVDDNSRDGSLELVESTISKEHPTVRIIVRTTERGLSSAVLRGFDEAKGDILLCMDADLQHPPESVPSMYKPYLTYGSSVVFVLGKREIPETSQWSIARRIISRGATLLAYPLTAGIMTDPMTGFFAVRATAYRTYKSRIDGVGYKIALEICVKCEAASANTKEVTFAFGERSVGESKLTGKVILHYLKHLRGLYMHVYLRKIIVAIIFLTVVAIYYTR